MKKNGHVARFGVSLETELLDELDGVVKANKFSNRSQALRSIIRERLVKEEWLKGREIAGTITLVYDHHVKGLMSGLTEAQHDHYHMIISTQHIHLDHDNCMEVIVVKGKPSDAQKLLFALKSIKGVKYGALSSATTAERLP